MLFKSNENESYYKNIISLKFCVFCLRFFRFLEQNDKNLTKEFLIPSFVFELIQKNILLPFYFSPSLFLSGNCAKIIATNIRTQPNNSFLLNVSCRIAHPANTDTTDSRLRIKDATVGFIPFWPTICKVFATPQDNTPAYKIGSHASRSSPIFGVSKRNIQTADNTPHTKNWIQDIFTPSVFGEK